MHRRPFATVASHAENVRFAFHRRLLPHSESEPRDLQIQFRSAEEQIEVAERIKIPKKGASRLEALIVLAADRFCPAKRIGNSLIEQPREQERKYLIGQ